MRYLISHDAYMGEDGDVWSDEFESDKECLIKLMCHGQPDEEVQALSLEELKRIWDMSNGDGQPYYIIKNEDTGETLVG